MSDTITEERPETEAPDDIRSAVAAAFDEAETTAPETPQPAAKPAAETPETTTTQRGPDGKFVKSDAEPVAKTTEEPAKPAAAAEPDGPAFAKSWAPAERDLLAKAPPEVKALIERRFGDLHADYTRKNQEAATFRNEWQPIAQMFAPHADVMQQKGLTPASTIQAWYNVERQLMSGGDGAALLLANVAKNYKVDPAAVMRHLGIQSHAPADPADPKPEGQQPALPPEVAERFQRYDQFIANQQAEREQQQRQQFNAQANQVMSSIDQFAAATDDAGALKHPHFRDVEADMTRHVLAVRAAGQPVPALADLYDMAVWANPATRAKVLAEQHAAEEAKRVATEQARQQEAREKAEKARRAASSVTGSPASQTPRRATGSLRDELEAAAEDLAA